jgi:hypothetical protein
MHGYSCLFFIRHREIVAIQTLPVRGLSGLLRVARNDEG